MYSQQSIDTYAPLITKKIKGRLCPWLSSEVKSEMNLRDQLLRKACRTNREIDWSSYKRQRNKVNSLVKKCASNYYKDLLQVKASSSDKFWSAIKKLYPTKITTGSVAAININRTKMSHTSSIAQGFCLRSWKGLYINSCCHTLRIMVCCHLSSSDFDPCALLN